MASAVGPLREAPSRRKRSLGVPPGLCAGGRGRSRALAAGARGAGGVGAASAPPSFAARPRRRPGDGPARPGRLLRGALTRARPGSVPAPPPPSPSPCRGGRLGPTRGRVVACAAAPRGCVPRRRPAGRRGVVRRRALSPGLRPRRAALRAGPRAPRRGRLSVVDGGARRPSLAVAGGVSRLRGGWCAALASRERERDRGRELGIGRSWKETWEEGPAFGGRPPRVLIPPVPSTHAVRRSPLLSSPLSSPLVLSRPRCPLLSSVATRRLRAALGVVRFPYPPTLRAPSVRPVAAGSCSRPGSPSAPAPAPARHAARSSLPAPGALAAPGRVRGSRRPGWWWWLVVLVVCVCGGWRRSTAARPRGLSPSRPSRGHPSPAARSLARRARVRACALRDATSDQTWRPAEFKHISQRRKRN